MNAYPFINLETTFGLNNILVFDSGLSQEYRQKLVHVIFHCLGLKKIPKKFSSWNKTNIFLWDQKEIILFKSFVCACLKIFVNEFDSQYRGKRPNYGTGWVNVVTNFDSQISSHRHHSNSFNLTGVYYLSGKSAQQGGTRFWINGITSSVIQEVAFKPGSLVLFPATLYHSISPYDSKVSRISLGLDIRFKREDFFSHPCVLLDSELGSFAVKSKRSLF